MSEASHSGHHAEEIQKHIKIYVGVFVALAFLTIVTVAISYLHLSIIPAVALALVVASIKGTLVASYFMHLVSEKRLIYIILIMTVLFFVFLLVLPALTMSEVAHHHVS